MQEKQEPIPSIYSQDLRDLAQKLLIKDFRARPDIKEITGTPFIKKVAEGFIARRGKLEDAIPIKTTELHKDMMDNDNEDQHYTQSTSTNVTQSRATEMLMTPAQRAQKRKEDQAEKRRQELMQASRQEHSYRISTGSSKQKKIEDMKSNFDHTGKSKGQNTIQLKTGQYQGFGADQTIATNAQTNTYYPN